MDDLAAELEASLTSGGTLLVWAEKYRYTDPALLPALRTRLLSLGDGARRLARRDSLDQRAARELLAAVGAVNAGLRQLIRACREDANYREAVACRTSGDAERLAVLLSRIFADLTVASPPAAAYWAPTWQRRGRPLPADDVAAQIEMLQADGIPATGDDLTPGTDPDLPGVLLATGMPLGSPLALRYDGHLLPRPSLRLGDDVVLVPTDRLHLPFAVVVAAVDEPLDEWIADPATYLDELERACRRRGLAVGR